MKKLLITTLAFLTATAFAAPASSPEASKPAAGAPLKRLTREEYEKLSPAEKKARHEASMERRYRRTGGTLVKPGTMSGELVYVNCQKRAALAWLEESAAYFRKQAKFNITIQDGAFDLLAPKIRGSVSLFVVDDEKLPPILFAPESRWAMVNVAPLAKGRGEKPAFFEARVKKELSRGCAMLCGATNSQFPMCILGGVTGADALDTYPDHRLPIDVIARFSPYLQPFGVTAAEFSTYRQACTEGWAPAPTNGVQKAIWDEVHKAPTAPIVIKPEPKKAK